MRKGKNIIKKKKKETNMINHQLTIQTIIKVLNEITTIPHKVKYNFYFKLS
jgi:hypothetical protein